MKRTVIRSPRRHRAPTYKSFSCFFTARPACHIATQAADAQLMDARHRRAWSFVCGGASTPPPLLLTLGSSHCSCGSRLLHQLFFSTSLGACPTMTQPPSSFCHVITPSLLSCNHFPPSLSLSLSKARSLPPASSYEQLRIWLCPVVHVRAISTTTLLHANSSRSSGR